MAPRRSARLRPQIHASEDGAGMAPRRIRRRRGTSPAAAASLPDDDDMLREILVRLPPQPSSLPRASAVCKRWRGLVTDPKFHRQFYAHHRKPPLLGAFMACSFGNAFVPMLDPPDRIPPQRFSLGRYPDIRGTVLNCRHGHVLIKHVLDRENVAVWDPITGEHHLVRIPSEFSWGSLVGAVLCAAAHHVHGGGCHSSPFKVVLVSIDGDSVKPIACVYSSETGLWSNLISTKATCFISVVPAVLIGNCLYWLAFTNRILVFNLDENSLTVIWGPPTGKNMDHKAHLHAQNGSLVLATLFYPRLQMWKRSGNAHGVAAWLLSMTIEMNTIPGLPSQIEEGIFRNLMGYDEDTDLLFLHVSGDVYGVQLKLMQSKKLSETHRVTEIYPFKNFYIRGIDIKSNAIMLPGTTFAGYLI